MDEFDLKKIAYHEAGHAVAHFIFHRRFSNISVVSKGDVLGEVYDPELTLSLATIYITGRSRFFFRTEKRLFQEVLISLAGVAAEAILKKEAVISYVKENLPSLIRDMRTLDVFLKMSNWPE
jgi:ATP-dependent Zn protease